MTVIVSAHGHQLHVPCLASGPAQGENNIHNNPQNYATECILGASLSRELQQNQIISRRHIDIWMEAETRGDGVCEGVLHGKTCR